MKFLKGLAIGLLSFVLFWLLTAFGIALTVDRVALNPGFFTGIIKDVDFSDTAREIFDEQQQVGEAPPPEIVDVLVDALDKAEPAIKEKLDIVIDDIYAYLLGRADRPDLKATLRESFMNAEFLDMILQGIDLSKTADQFLKEQATAGDASAQALLTSIVTTVDRLEPSLKKQLVNASDPVFKYVLSETNTIDLKGTLRQTVLNRDFVIEVINTLDIKSVARNMLSDQIQAEMPAGIKLNSGEIDQIITALEPGLKTGLIAAADPIADYLMGIKAGFTATVPLSPALTVAKSTVKQAFLRQLPPQLVNAPTAAIDQAYEQVWSDIKAGLPVSFTLNSSMLDSGIPTAIDDGLVNLQVSLTDMRNSIGDIEKSLTDDLSPVRANISTFRTVYWLIILAILVAIGLVVLIHRSVKGACRDLGIVFTIYGAIQFAAIVVLKTIFGNPEGLRGVLNGIFWNWTVEIPESVLPVLASVVRHTTQPLFIFSLVCLVTGIALIVVSIIYGRRPPREVEVVTRST